MRVSAGASAIAALTVPATSLIRGTHPFGATTRSVNDLGDQVIPMYAYARDALTGDAHGGLIWSWQSGHGVPFLGDALAYVGTTLSWLTVLFPRDRIDLALYAVFVLAVAAGAFFMALLLQRLRPEGPAWLAVVGGVAYGAGAWPVESAYMTVWLNGMVAFPLLCLLADWVVSTPRWQPWVAAPPLVAIAWTSHFYTAYMATIGAAVFIVARLLTRTEVPVGQRLVALARCGLVFLLGIGLAAPLLVPVFRLVRGATSTPPTELTAVAWDTFLARLLPGTAGVADTPAIGVGVLTLVLALTAALNPRMPAAERLVWPATVILVIVSMRFPPTHLVWHAFDNPNGNPYRQSFVTAGLLVVTAWLSAASGVRSRHVVAGSLLVGALWVWTRGAPDRTPLTTPVVVVMLVLVVVGWALLSARRRGRAWATAGAGLLLLATAAEATASHVAIDERRSTVLATRAAWGERHEAARAAVLDNDDWPASRTDPGRSVSDNDPMLLGGQGSEYYSSTIQTSVSDLHADLGWGYHSYGRELVDPELAVTDAIFATSTRLLTPAEGAPAPADDRVDVVRRDAVAPLVSVRARSDTTTARPGVWGAHERALGGPLYEVPDVTLTAGRGSRVWANTTSRQIRSRPGATALLTARCTPGSQLLLHAPSLVGQVSAGERRVDGLTPQDRTPGLYTGLPLRSLGTVGPEGVVSVRITPGAPATSLPLEPLGCLDPGRLERAVEDLQAAAAEDVRTGARSIDFRVPAGAPGAAQFAVISTTNSPGWRCTGAVARAGVESFDGFMGIPLSGEAGRVSCDYLPSGTRLGLIGGGLAALTWLGALALGLWVSRRRSGAAPVRLAR